MKPFTKKVNEVLSELNVNSNEGLSEKKAQTLLFQDGENKLQGKKKESLIIKFIGQFKDIMILILIVAAGISFFIASIEGGGKAYFEPILILAIVLLNAILGFSQEMKAEKALEALQKMSSPKTRVIRDGLEKQIEASKVVIGDIIKLEAGDYIPADARLIESSSLKSEESALTGESVPSEKDAKIVVDENAPIGDRHNMIYSGCSITYGTAKAVITSTGMNTEMGKIATLLNSSKNEETPLQIKLAKLGRILGLAALAICLIIFGVGYFTGMELIHIFMISVSLAVSAIPEGLPAIVTIVLALGVSRMVKKNSIIRKLSAVETLGSASVICSDKTGTLTQNKMTLTKVFLAESGESEDISNNNSDLAKKLLFYSTLCTNASISIENDEIKEVGDPTETAIVTAAFKNGIIKSEILSANVRQLEKPFDSERKLMSVINEIDNKNIVIVKGAFDVLASRCSSGDVEAGKVVANEFSSKALRVLGVAYKEISNVPSDVDGVDIETDLTFLGLLGMIDPPRKEARNAVKIARKAGIKPVMITGDHIITASAIATEIGIMVDGDEAITGLELNSMSDDELLKRIASISVYARVSPEDKIRIVKAWKSRGDIVAMTGDGVNDAPALKSADIGCAMGITGTDVSKGAADMILTDDNFATIVEATREGRGIYNNIKKTVGFLLGTNIGEVVTVFVAMIFWHKSPLLSMQLLWINLVTDSLPAIALGMEKVDDDVMEQKPRPKDESIFAGGLGIQIIFQGIVFGALTLIGFIIAGGIDGTDEGLVAGRTMAFIVLAMSQVFHSLNMRSNHSIFKIGVFTNKSLNRAILISTLLTLAIVFVPFISSMFGLTSLSVEFYLIALGLALVPILVLEILKFFKIIK